MPDLQIIDTGLWQSVKARQLATRQSISKEGYRPEIQGTVTDTDMHGASFAMLLEELELGSSD